jgi:hypothetical protein
MVHRPVHMPALLLSLLAAGCSCPNVPLDPLPSGDDTSANPLDSDPETNPWDSDVEPQDSEPDDTIQEGTNQLMNGGFEQGEGNYTGVGYGWETVDGASHGENWLEQHTPFSGNASQCIGPSWSAAAIHQLTRENTVRAGDYYRLRAQVRVTAASSGHGWYVFGLRWYQDDTMLSEVQMLQPHSISYDWTPIVIDMQAPENANRASAYLAANTDGTTCYDELVFAQLIP